MAMQKDRVYNFVERISDAKTQSEFSEMNNRQNDNSEQDNNLLEIQKQVREFEALLNNSFDATNNNNSNDDINDTIKKHLRLAGL